MDGTAFSVSVTLWGFGERQLFKIRRPKPIVHFIFDKLVKFIGIIFILNLSMVMVIELRNLNSFLARIKCNSNIHVWGKHISETVFI